MSRRAVLLFVVILAVSSLIIVKAVPASAYMPKPSIPEFTVELIDSSYDEPPTSSVNPYTGQTETQLGYHVESRTIRISIKNQPFTPFQVQDENGNNWTADLCFNIRIKGHFSEDWIELYLLSDGYPSQNYESEYTVLSYTGEYSSAEGMKSFIMGTKMIDVPPDGQIDFQTEAMIGYVHREISSPVPGSGWVFTGETSGWSKTQTLTISANAPEPSPDGGTPSNNETQQIDTSSLISGVIITAILVLLSVGSLLYFKKRSREAEHS